MHKGIVGSSTQFTVHDIVEGGERYDMVVFVRMKWVIKVEVSFNEHIYTKVLSFRFEIYIHLALRINIFILHV